MHTQGSKCSGMQYAFCIQWVMRRKIQQKQLLTLVAKVPSKKGHLPATHLVLVSGASVQFWKFCAMIVAMTSNPYYVLCGARHLRKEE